MDHKIIVPQLPLTGGCQCGAIRYSISANPLTLYACHCTECQAQSSSAFGLSMRVPARAVLLNGDVRSCGRTDTDSPPVEGLFCPRCGSRLIHKRAGGGTVNIKAGTLDDTRWIVPIGHLWARSAMSGFKPAPGPLVYDGQPDTYDALISAWADATSSA